MPLNAIILSDIYGFSNESNADDRYLQRTAIFLQKMGYSTHIFSLLQLAKLSAKSENDADSAFVAEIIEQSAANLAAVKLSCDLCIGFSAGGTVLWNMVAEGKLKTDKLVCISSTRLRHITDIAPYPALVIFGQLDEFAPTHEKLESLKCNYKIVPGFDHNFYKYEILEDIFSEIGQLAPNI